MFGRNKKMQDKIASYRAVFNTEDGRKILFDLMRTHYLLSSSFNPDALEMARMEGERNVVLRILNIINTDPEKFRKLIEDVREHEQLYEEE